MGAVYFYHTQDIQFILGRMEQGQFPAHFLYGATQLPGHGIEVIYHQSRLGLPRWRTMLRTTFQVLASRRRFDAVYATHYQGLELLAFLRALWLFRKPLVVWHHQPVVVSRQWWRELLGRCFYRGFDKLVFFSQKLVDESLQTGKVRADQVVLGHWGADLSFYDGLTVKKSSKAVESPSCQRSMPFSFVSTGKELRDMPTLVAAFNRVASAPLDIYINRKNGEVSYEELFSRLELGPNVVLHYTDRLMPYELSLEVKQADCVVICCMESNYTVGLTTLVEALALGKPVICSRNPNFPIDVELMGCGISVPYGDVEGWVRAIEAMLSRPDKAREMGRRGRELAESIFNDVRCGGEMAAVLRQISKI